ncbi:10693_t:CDS:2 [Diversispora eburnea]|uniref:10693_t:CDS:1 n=1 Tax=Diversispora eburnea TaxID=1213867 RepID=A0A9N9FFS2_9GLOM|nr:10693_t:CDS:2 [Diversispora eburnea]
MSSSSLANALLRDINLNTDAEHRQEYFDLVAAADELALVELVDYIQEHIILSEKGWLLENFVQIFQKISSYKALRKLQDYCAELICNDPSEEFHKRCDYKGTNVVVVKIQGSPIVVGGYNPLGWTSSNDWRQTTESFIFSLSKDHKSAIISRVKNPRCAIRDTISKQWIGFGVGDLHFLDGVCTPHDYEHRILETTKFLVEDYEVFQVLNKVKPVNT